MPPLLGGVIFRILQAYKCFWTQGEAHDSQKMIHETDLMTFNKLFYIKTYHLS
jgi:hypothetical protein